MIVLDDGGNANLSGQIVQRFCNITMIGAEGFLADRQRSLVERLGIGIAALPSKFRAAHQREPAGREPAGDCRLVELG